MASKWFLHVEDNPGDAKLLFEAIVESRADLEVMVAPSGVRAMEQLHQASEEQVSLPNFIVLDLNMPVMNGLTLLRILSQHQEWRHIPVVILTSSASADDKARTSQLGALAYITKPSDFDGYLALARRLDRFPTLESTPSGGSTALIG